MKNLFLFILLSIVYCNKYENWKLRFRYTSVERPGPNKKNPKGEDAHCVNDVFISVADGVGGWGLRGFDPSLFSNKLVKNLLENFENKPEHYTQNLRELGTLGVSLTNEIGTSTLVMVSLDKELPILYSNNLGDSGYMIFRKYKNGFRLHFKSVEQQQGFNFPIQVGFQGNDPNTSVINQHIIKQGDIVLVGSDGLFDNLFNWDIERIVNYVYSREGLNLQKMADIMLEESLQKSQDLTYHSPFSKNAQSQGIQHVGGKDDDTTIVIAEIIENNQGSEQPQQTSEQITEEL